MATIAKLAVKLVADSGDFTAGTLSAGRALAALRSGFDRATNSAEAFKRLNASTTSLKLAGADTLTTFRSTLAVARSELRRFGRNQDVKIAVDIGRANLNAAWTRAHGLLQRLAAVGGINVRASIVANKASDVRSWIDQQRRQLLKPITVRLELAKRSIQTGIASAMASLDRLRRYRAVRIAISALNGTRLPVQAALATLGPLTRLAGRGVVVALRATHVGIATAVTKARSLLSGLSSFGSSVVGSLTSGFGLVGLAVGALGGYSLSGLVHSSMEAIDANAKLSDRLGITTQGLVGLQHASKLAGVADDQLTIGLQKMLKNLADAAAGGGPASDALRTLGLDAKALANGTPDAAFKQIADGLKGIENPAQRAQVAVDIFGKTGQSLLPLMMKGADGIAAAQAEAEKLGLTFNRVDAAKVEAANESFVRLQAILQGVVNQFAIALAPYIDAAVAKLTNFASEGGGIGPKVGGAVEWVVSGLATLSDYLSLGVAGWKLLQAGATYAVFGIVKAVDAIGQKLVDLINLLPGMSVKWTTFTGQLADGLLDEAKKLQGEAGQSFGSFMRGDNAKAASQAFQNIRDSATKAAEGVAAAAPKMKGAFQDVEDDATKLDRVAESLAGIQKQSEQFGLSESRKKLMDLQAAGASQQQLADAKKLLDVQDSLTKVGSLDTGNALGDFQTKINAYLDAFNAGKLSLEQMTALGETAKATLADKLGEQAKSITDSVKTPLEKYQEEVSKLNTLLDRGFVTKDIYDRALASAKKTLDTADGADVKPAAPAAIRSQSAQSQRYAYDQSRGAQKLGSKDDIAKKQLDTQNDSHRLLDLIERSVRPDATVQTVVDV